MNITIDIRYLEDVVGTEMLNHFLIIANTNKYVLWYIIPWLATIIVVMNMVVAFLSATFIFQWAIGHAGPQLLRVQGKGMHTIILFGLICYESITKFGVNHTTSTNQTHHVVVVVKYYTKMTFDKPLAAWRHVVLTFEEMRDI